MRDRLRRRPQVESLESMTLLSGAASAMAGAAAMVATTPPVSHEIDLNGTAHGTYNVHSSNPDVGKTYNFFGSGHVSPLRRSDVTGNVQTLGNIAMGNAHGMLVLSDPRGSVTLQLTGPDQKGFDPIPDHFTYKITNGSGKFRNATGSGVVVLVLDPGKAATTTTPVTHGHFTMVFISIPTPTA